MQQLRAQGLLALPIDWTPLASAHSADALMEYRRFLVMKTLKHDLDINALQLSPSGPVDEVWHAHLLLPKHYVEVCSILLGHGEIFDHSTETAHDPNRDARYKATLEFYESLWGPPNPNMWPREDPRPKSPSKGLKITVKMNASSRQAEVPLDPSEPVEVLFHHIRNLWGIPVDQQRYIIRGKQLDMEMRIGDCLHNKDVVLLCLRLRGC